jgi:antitoxin ParD1/3/4
MSGRVLWDTITDLLLWCGKDYTLMLVCLMAAKHSRHIALTGPLAAYVDEQVLQGKYASASDIVRAALRLLIERDASVAAHSIGRAKSHHDQI